MGKEAFKVFKRRERKMDSKTIDARYLIELQQDKIKFLEETNLSQEKEIKFYSKRVTPLWDDILFDVRTKQVYADNTCTNFKIYEMKQYQDFYQRLGYSQSEAEKYWRITQKMMINREGMSTSEQRGFFRDGNLIPNLINFEKTDTKVTSVEECIAHFKFAIKHNVASQIQIYNACYYKKDGSELLAILSVLYDFINNSSETKIKFLDF